MDAKERGFVGQLQEADEEARADAGDDAEVHDAGEKSERTGEDAEAAAVTHLEKLRQRHGARLPVAVVDKAGHGDDDAGRDGELLPPHGGESRLVKDLKKPDDHDCAPTHFRARHADEITPGGPSTGHEIGDARHETARVDHDGEHNRRRQEKLQPIKKSHRKWSKVKAGSTMRETLTEG